MNCTGVLIESSALKSVERYLEDVVGGAMEPKQESCPDVPRNKDGIPATAFDIAQKQEQKQ